jgi:hypothetical protein
MSDSIGLFDYFTPETLLPLTSIAATIAGIVIMVGRGSIRFTIHCVRRARCRRKEVTGIREGQFRARYREQLPVGTRS